MNKAKYIEVLTNNPHMDELMRMGFANGVVMCAIKDPEITESDIKEIIDYSLEDE